MIVFRHLSDYADWHLANCSAESPGFVPTMGYLHEGHLSLVRASKARCQHTVCSIFVNPIQFNNPEDLIHYPRNEERDLQMLSETGCDVVLIPTAEEMYPEPVTTTYRFPGIDDVLEGAFRPGHFSGVAVVVARLFEIVKPSVSFFGKKDYQQLMIIKELAKQQFREIEIVGMPIIREADGLAMSSRNARLLPEEREMAPLIHEVLLRSKKLMESFSPAEVQQHCIRMLENSGMIKPEYFVIADKDSLHPITNQSDAKRAVAFVAAWLGKVRLIDNLEYFS